MVFAIHQHDSATGARVPPSWTPSHLPPHPIPQGCPRALALGALLHASNLHCSPVLHMVIDMFQCYSLKSSHRVQKSVLYICVSFAAFHIGSLLLSFLIPYICVNILYWCFSSWLSSLWIIGSSFIHLISTHLNACFFHSWVIFHCVYVPQILYPFIW